MCSFPGGKQKIDYIFQWLTVRIMRWRSQPETLVSLVIMWGSIPRLFTQNDFHSAITNFPLYLSTRSSTAEMRCYAWLILGEKSCGYIVDGY